MTFDPQPHAQGDQSARGFALGATAGRAIELPGWSMLVKVTAADTVGGLSVLQGRMTPRLSGPAPHIHNGHDETFVVLKGRLRFRLGDDFHTALPGDTVFAGRRLAHGFSNPFDEPASYLVILTPSGYEEYFATIEDHVAHTGRMPDPDQLRQLMAQHQTVVAQPMADPGT